MNPRCISNPLHSSPLLKITAKSLTKPLRAVLFRLRRKTPDAVLFKIQALLSTKHSNREADTIMRVSDGASEGPISLFNPGVRSRYPQKRARKVIAQRHCLFLNELSFEV
jgi:hypothetical protein